MAKEGVSYQDLYKLVDDRTNQIMSKFEDLEKRVSVLEGFKAQILIIGSVVIFFANIFADWIKTKLGFK